MSGSIETAILVTGIGHATYYRWQRKVRDGVATRLEENFVRESEAACADLKLRCENLLFKHGQKALEGARLLAGEKISRGVEGLGQQAATQRNFPDTRAIGSARDPGKVRERFIDGLHGTRRNRLLDNQESSLDRALPGQGRYRGARSPYCGSENPYKFAASELTYRCRKSKIEVQGHHCCYYTFAKESSSDQVSFIRCCKF